MLARRTKIILAAGAGLCLVLLLGVMMLIGFRFLTGRPVGFGLWHLKHLALSLRGRQAVVASAQGRGTSVIFLHHSTGNNMVEEGGVRELFTDAGFDFWDHHYNPTGLRDPDGQYKGYSYRIPADNTDPDGLARIFSQRVYGQPVNAFSGLLQHEVIAFKSCFPASNITSEEQLQQYKDWYVGMRDVMDQHPDHLFIVMSPPPLHPANTTPEAAARARAFADWLASDAYLEGHPNVYTFDFFDALAEADPASPEHNMLRAAYRLDTVDSHPSEVANAAVGPLFAEAVMDAARSYWSTRGGQE